MLILGRHPKRTPGDTIYVGDHMTIVAKFSGFGRADVEIRIQDQVKVHTFTPGDGVDHDDIRVQLMSARPGFARIGIDAPKGLSIQRDDMRRDAKGRRMVRA